jgi:hypothetical protein
MIQNMIVNIGDRGKCFYNSKDIFVSSMFGMYPHDCEQLDLISVYGFALKGYAAQVWNHNVFQFVLAPGSSHVCHNHRQWPRAEIKGFTFLQRMNK